MVGWAVFSGGLWGGDKAMAYFIQKPEGVWEAVVLTEAAGEPYEGKVGVAEVIRNRGWSQEGFIGIQRRDVRRFLSQQPAWVHEQARRALREARAGSNLTRRATHFENVEAFGRPVWERNMEVTSKIGRLIFFRERSVQDDLGVLRAKYSMRVVASMEKKMAAQKT